MKQFTLTNAHDIELEKSAQTLLYFAQATGGDDMDISDGYHTMTELYDHRITNFIALCKLLAGMNYVEREMKSFREGFAFKPEEWQSKVWRSKKHSDGELAFGGTWFVLGINREAGEQITYHLPVSCWEETEFAETLEFAPEWDGHTSAMVLERLKAL